MRLSAWCGWILAAAAALTPLYAYLGPLGFPVLVAQLGLFCLPAFRIPAESRIGAGLLCLLVAWAAASTLWSPYVASTFEQNTALKLILQAPIYWAALCAGARVQGPARRRAAVILAFGLSLVALVLIAESATGAALYRAILEAIGQPLRPDLAARNVGQSIFVLALLMWALPAAGLGRLGWVSFGLCAAGVLVSSAAFRADAPAIALALSGLAYLAVRAWRGRALTALGASAAVAFAAAPLLVRIADMSGLIGWIARFAPLSWDQRLDYWRAAAHHIGEKPIAGWGLDASRVFPMEMTLHPHDAALQVWLELGVVGALLAAAFWAWLFLRLRSAAPGRATAGAAAAVTYLTFAAFSFGVWQEWQLALGALASAFIAGLPGETERAAEST